jgi:hypothetical protein
MPSSLEKLFIFCELKQVGLTIEYDPGYYIPGEYAMLPEKEALKYMRRGPSGYSVEVGGYSIERSLFKSLEEAVTIGWSLLNYVLEKEDRNEQPE